MRVYISVCDSLSLILPCFWLSVRVYFIYLYYIGFRFSCIFGYNSTDVLLDESVFKQYINNCSFKILVSFCDLKKVSIILNAQYRKFKGDTKKLLENAYNGIVKTYIMFQQNGSKCYLRQAFWCLSIVYKKSISFRSSEVEQEIQVVSNMTQHP